MKEIWKDIKGYEGIYQVSNLGRVRTNTSHGKGKIMKFCKQKCQGGKYGYYHSVKLYKNGESKDFRVHRLVAEAFIPNPDNLPIVNHKDENKLNNRVDNLEWCTHKYNNEYKPEGYEPELPDLGFIKILEYADGTIEIDLSDMQEKCNKFLEDRRKNK